MDLELGGRVAMVAAASKGMGRASAMGLAREGARVSICARTAADIEAAAADIREQTGAQVLAMAADVTNPTDIQTWVDRTIQQFGGVDILVGNAGGPPRGNWDDYQEDQAWQKAFELNLLSSIRLVRAVVPSMRQRGGGRVLSIQSTSVKAPIEDLILSNTIRPGVVGLFKSLSRELAKDKILVNVVCPGRIYTDRLRSGIVARAEQSGISEEESAREHAKNIPLQRFGTPEEFADMIVFLASARASYVTGSVIAVDGGVLESGW